MNFENISKRVNNESSLSRSHQNFSNQRSKTELVAGDNESANPIFAVGPLSSFTQESLDVIKVAASQIDYSKDLRTKSTALIKDCLEYSKKNTKVVDEVFQKKIAETLVLSVRKKYKISYTKNIFRSFFFLNEFSKIWEWELVKII